MIGVVNINKFETIVRWKISSFAKKEKKKYDSHTFSFATAKCNRHWWFRCYPNGVDENAKGYVSMYIHCSANVTASLELSIIDTGKKRSNIHEKKSYKVTPAGWGADKFVKRAELVTTKQFLLLNDGTLTVQCIITVEPGDIKSHSRFTNFLEELLKSHYLSDILMQAGTTRIPAHKCLLAAKSNVFKDMFIQTPKLEYINTEGIREEVVEELLTFIYTGNSPNISNMPEELYQAANKFGVQDLEKACASYMSETVTKANARARLDIGKRYDLSILVKRASKFIS